MRISPYYPPATKKREFGENVIEATGCGSPLTSENYNVFITPPIVNYHILILPPSPPDAMYS